MEVAVKTNVIWWEGDFDDWMKEVQVNLDHGHRTMTETEGMGILSEQGWKKKRSTVEVFLTKMEREEAWRMLDQVITMAWEFGQV